MSYPFIVIVLADLDNTLVDRSAAFSAWASSFVAQKCGDASDVTWLLAADRNGYRPRVELAQEIIERFCLNSNCQQVADQLQYEHLELIRPFPGVKERLESLASAGSRVVVVTNGASIQQAAKMVRTGLRELVADLVVSESVQVKKPDRRIFEIAIGRAINAGGTGPTWMIGDHPVFDIWGARNCGIATGWVSHGAEWTARWLPTVSRRSCADVLDYLLRT